MATPTELIKERLNIVDIIRSYVKLEKTGVNFRACCPFHTEKTPSFFVSSARQSYYCFGCNRGGDVFTFVQEIEGLNFPEALSMLASKAGVELSKERVAHKDPAEAEKLYLENVLEIATRYFEKRLSENQDVLSYLTNRGLTTETITKFRLGFAPDGWRNLVDFCDKQKIKKPALERSGLSLLSPKNNDYYDRFRSRIMFPITNKEGRVAGFSGRIFGENQNQNEAKYVNTPQTLLYDKSRILYGYHLAKNAIRKTSTAILVEGQMDLIMSHQAGVENALAVSGTALTVNHLNLLKRLADKLIMAFDGDSAGIKASGRAVMMALEMGFEIGIAPLPEGQDPADIVKTDPKAWQKLVEESIHVIDFYLQVIDKESKNDHQNKHRRIREDVYPLISVLAHKVDQAYFIQKIAERLKVTEDSIWQDLETFIRLNDSNKNNTKENLPVSVTEQPALMSREEKVEKTLIGLIWSLEEKNVLDSVSKIKEEIKNLFNDNYINDLTLRYEKNKSSLLLEIDLLYDGKNLDAESSLLILELKEIKLRKELVEITKLLQLAETKNETDLVDKYIKKCQDISKSITDLISKRHA